MLTPSSPPPPAAATARQFNPAEIRPFLETIDWTALSPASSSSYPRQPQQPPLSRIKGAETLLEILYSRRERSRDGTMEPKPEPKPSGNDNGAADR